VADRDRAQKHVAGADYLGDGRWLRQGGDPLHSLVDLQTAIDQYLAEHNRSPKPFTWTADPDRIIEKVNRGHQAIASYQVLSVAFAPLSCPPSQVAGKSACPDCNTTPKHSESYVSVLGSAGQGRRHGRRKRRLIIL
jgi:hypothetical protein